MSFSRSLLSYSWLVLFVGAASSWAADTSIAERFTALIEKMAGVVVADQSDCNKMASDLSALASSNAALIKDMAASQKSKTALRPDASQQARMAAASVKMQGGMQKCQASPAVAAAMKKFK